MPEAARPKRTNPMIDDDEKTLSGLMEEEG